MATAYVKLSWDFFAPKLESDWEKIPAEQQRSLFKTDTHFIAVDLIVQNPIKNGRCDAEIEDDAKSMAWIADVRRGPRPRRQNAFKEKVRAEGWGRAELGRFSGTPNSGAGTRRTPKRFARNLAALSDYSHLSPVRAGLLRALAGLRWERCHLRTLVFARCLA